MYNGISSTKTGTLLRSLYDSHWWRWRWRCVPVRAFEPFFVPLKFPLLSSIERWITHSLLLTLQTSRLQCVWKNYRNPNGFHTKTDEYNTIALPVSLDPASALCTSLCGTRVATWTPRPRGPWTPICPLSRGCPTTWREWTEHRATQFEDDGVMDSCCPMFLACLFSLLESQSTKQRNKISDRHLDTLWIRCIL